ncbi:hypothetical protein RDI58_010185 [Solanum bulbocastanum]|uniref:Uncharacterized protein n=1 Tax=Solanum bulbocastanum TaxID=147425 RepID=A0AAN8TQG9_SOLBU
MGLFLTDRSEPGAQITSISIAPSPNFVKGSLCQVADGRRLLQNFSPTE